MEIEERIARLDARIASFDRCLFSLNAVEQRLVLSAQTGKFSGRIRSLIKDIAKVRDPLVAERLAYAKGIRK